MNKKVKKTVAFIMSFIMIFFALNSAFFTTLNAEEISEQQENATAYATATDAEPSEISEISTEIDTDVVEEAGGIETYATVDTNYTFTLADGGSISAVCENEHTPVVAHTSGGNQLHCIDASLSSAFQWTNYGWQSGGLTWAYSEISNSSMADVLFEYYKGDNPNRSVSSGEMSGGTASAYNQLTHKLDEGSGGTRTAPTKESYKIVNASGTDVSGKTINATVDIANGVQKTETLTFLTGSTYLHHYVTVPSGVTMHYTPYDTGVSATATNTTVALVNNSTAYFTAPLTANINVSVSSTCINRDFTTGYYIGSLYILAPQKQLVNTSGSHVTLQRFMYCDGLTASEAFSISFANLGSIKIQKVSANPDITDGNDCYSLEGAQFTVQSEDKSKSWTLTTKADGTAQLDNIPVGNYTVKETKAPTKGYVLNPTVFNVTVTTAHTPSAPYTVIVPENPKADPVRAMVQKQSAEGDYEGESLEGAEFTVKFYKGVQQNTDPALDGKVADRVWVIKTTLNIQSGKVFARLDNEHKVSGDDFYLSSNGTPTLPFGTVTIEETKAPNGFVIDNTVYVRTITDDGGALEEVSTYNMPIISNSPLYSYLRIIKADSKTGASIISSNAVFKIWDYKNDEYISFDNISEFETDSEGIALPGRLINGTYRLEEIKCPDGYYSKGNGNMDITITNAEGALYEVYIDENGNITDEILTTVTVYNEAVHGVITIEKSAENRKWDEKEGFVSNDIKLSDIEFGIYAAKDIYSMDGHGTLLYKEGDRVCTIVTDEDGYAESEELYFGSYTVVEENTPPEYEASEQQTVEISLDDEAVDITKDGELKKLIYKNIEVYNAAKVPEIKTTATDSETKSHVGAYNEEAKIEDVVHYSNLIPGREYTLSGVLMVKSTGKPLLDMAGNEIVSTTTFTAEKANGDVSLIYTFDSRLLAGQTIVVFEDLYLDNEKVATHADIEDGEQSIYYPRIGTQAVAEDGTKVHIAYGMLDITDTCSYENVVPGYWYSVSGILMDRATNEPLLDDDGCIITAETSFYADKSSGMVDVSYSVDVTWKPGYYIVVFEELYFAETGTKIAAHKDINDDNQTIKIKERGWLVLHGAQSPAWNAWHSRSPETGDRANVKVIAVMGMIALFLGAAMLLVKRKKNEKKERKVIVIGQEGTGKRLLVLCLSVGLSLGLCNVTAYAEEAKENEAYVITDTKTYDTDDESKYDFGFEDEIIADGISYKLDHIEYDKTSIYESVYGEEEVQTEITKEQEKIKNQAKESFEPEQSIFENDMEYVFKNVKFEKNEYAKKDAVKTLETDVLQSLNINEYPESLEYEYDGEKYKLPYSRYEKNTGWYSGFKLTGTIYGYDGGSFRIGDEALTDEQLNDTATLKIFMKENGYGADIYRPVSFEYVGDSYVSAAGKVCRDYIISYDLYGTVYTLVYEEKLDAPLYKAIVTYELSTDSTKKLEEMKGSFIVTATAYYVEQVKTEGKKGLTGIQKAALGAGIVFLIILFIAFVIYLLKGGRKPTDYKSERDIRRDYKELK